MLFYHVSVGSQIKSLRQRGSLVTKCCSYVREEMHWRLQYETGLEKVLNIEETEKPMLLKQFHKIFIPQSVENRYKKTA